MENERTPQTNAITTSVHVSTGVVPLAGGDRGVAGGSYRQLVRVLELVQPKELSRLQKQASMTSEKMLQELPKTCDNGVKFTGKGYLERWTGDEPPLPLRPRIPTRSWRISSRSLSDHAGRFSTAGSPLVVSSAH